MSEIKLNPVNDPDIKSFKDENETIFVKGPFIVNNLTYDYKLIEPNGEEDYCTVEQMLSWNLTMTKKLA